MIKQWLLLYGLVANWCRNRRLLLTEILVQSLQCQQFFLGSADMLLVSGSGLQFLCTAEGLTWRATL